MATLKLIPKHSDEKPELTVTEGTGSDRYPSWLNNIAEKMVLKAFSSMSRGYLELLMPNGQCFQWGNKISGYPLQPGFQGRIQVSRKDFFGKILLFGHVGFAEAYMDADWKTDDISEVIAWGILNVDNSPVLEGSQNHNLILNALGTINRIAHQFRANSLKVSRTNIHDHYDLSNDFFKLFLDPGMTYSSARFEFPEQSLEDAQNAKYDALCKMLRLKPDDQLLEIGTGWGGFSIHAARHYGCRITTTTISTEQHAYAKARFAEAGLADRITLEMKDYRLLTGQYDKIASIEMLEAVGDAYLETFFAQCARLLKPHGLLGMQMILCPDSRYALLKDNVDFIQKHIFPGSLIPSLARIQQAMNRTGALFLHELDDMGPSYVKTLSLWHEAFNTRLPEIRALGFDEWFIRKWNYYFKYCQAAFDTRNITVAQAVYTRPNNPLLRENIQ